MAGLSFTFQVPGDQAPQIMRRFERLGKNLRQPLLLAGRPIADDFLRIERKHFETEGARAGTSWAPLKASTLKTKPPGLPIMVRSGKLEAALSSRSGAHMERLTGTEIELGVKSDILPYAEPHQAGTRGLRGSRTQDESTPGMPRRPLIELTEADKLRWLKFIQRSLVILEREQAAGPFARGPLP
jgi:phage virion morphogenesis protein